MAGLTRMVFLTALGVVCSLAADLRPRALEEDEKSLSRILGNSRQKRPGDYDSHDNDIHKSYGGSLTKSTVDVEYGAPRYYYKHYEYPLGHSSKSAYNDDYSYGNNRGYLNTNGVSYGGYNGFRRLPYELGYGFDKNGYNGFRRLPYELGYGFENNGYNGLRRLPYEVGYGFDNNGHGGYFSNSYNTRDYADLSYGNGANSYDHDEDSYGRYGGKYSDRDDDNYGSTDGTYSSTVSKKSGGDDSRDGYTRKSYDHDDESYGYGGDNGYSLHDSVDEKKSDNFGDYPR